VKIFIACLGTLGDLNPHISLGTELAARGHDVMLLGDEGKREAAHASGLKFAEVLSKRRWEYAMQRAFASRDTSLQETFQHLCLPTIIPVFKQVLAHHEPGNTVLVGVPSAIGLKLAQEKLRLPLVHLYLNAFQAMRDTSSSDPQRERQVVALFNQLRRLADLPELPMPLQDWIFSADASVAAFPQWYGEADGNGLGLQYTNFIFSDEVRQADDFGPLDEFLAKDNKAIVFTAGTGAQNVESFFAAAASACERLSSRAIFLSATAPPPSPRLPSHVFHSRYVPLGRLLPRVGLIVHHGGIGTCAQAIRAGIYQLIKPLAFDQFDNAQRLSALGLSETLPESANDVELASAIERVRRQPEVGRRCTHLAGQLRGRDARGAVADLIEAAS
jgi:UDP:flavonoid glycosyltransferase YjiC (YdhE family)